MEWSYIVQTAVDYIEENLSDEIDYDQVADEVGVSSFHFHRVFNMIVGMSCAEYIRKRRLTLAAETIRFDNKTIIDVAYDYGYQSPESFNKAFVRFHGVTPKEARKSNATLNICAPLKIRMTVAGGTKMKYRIEEKEAMSFVVRSRAFANEIAGAENNQDISGFWNEFLSEKNFALIGHLSSDDASYGICSPQREQSGRFDYGIGVRTNGSVAPDGFENWQVPESTWAVFECHGSDGTCIAEMWKRIFNEFLLNTRYEMLESFDMERYPDKSENNLFCEIWIPVKVKRDQ